MTTKKKKKYHASTIIIFLLYLSHNLKINLANHNENEMISICPPNWKYFKPENACLMTIWMQHPVTKEDAEKICREIDQNATLLSFKITNGSFFEELIHGIVTAGDNDETTLFWTSMLKKDNSHRMVQKDQMIKKERMFYDDTGEADEEKVVLTSNSSSSIPLDINHKEDISNSNSINIEDRVHKDEILSDHNKLCLVVSAGQHWYFANCKKDRGLPICQINEADTCSLQLNSNISNNSNYNSYNNNNNKPCPTHSYCKTVHLKRICVPCPVIIGFESSSNELNCTNINECKKHAICNKTCLNNNNNVGVSSPENCIPLTCKAGFEMKSGKCVRPLKKDNNNILTAKDLVGNTINNNDNDYDDDNTAPRAFSNNDKNDNNINDDHNNHDNNNNAKHNTSNKAKGAAESTDENDEHTKEIEETRDQTSNYMLIAAGCIIPAALIIILINKWIQRRRMASLERNVRSYRKSKPWIEMDINNINRASKEQSDRSKKRNASLENGRKSRKSSRKSKADRMDGNDIATTSKEQNNRNNKREEKQNQKEINEYRKSVNEGQRKSIQHHHRMSPRVENNRKSTHVV